MHQTLGAFRAALLTGWIALSAAGVVYARQNGIPLWTAVPIIAAFLTEFLFYLASGFESVRARLRARLSNAGLAAVIALSALVPYLIYSIPTGEFRWAGFAALTALSVTLAFWYIALSPSPIADILFLVLIAATVLGGLLNYVYLTPIRPHLDILGHLMLVHAGAFVMLDLRRVENIGFGFIPTPREWIAGARYFAYFLPIGFPLAIWLDLARLNFTGVFPFERMLLTFFVILWSTALSEEFFFRGLLQQWLAQWTGKHALALPLASLVFGAAHLSFRHFPNWRMALVSAVAGWFYGMAYRKTGGIRAAMVAHGLVVTVWRTLFV